MRHWVYGFGVSLVQNLRYLCFLLFRILFEIKKANRRQRRKRRRSFSIQQSYPGLFFIDDDGEHEHENYVGNFSPAL